MSKFLLSICIFSFCYQGFSDERISIFASDKNAKLFGDTLKADSESAYGVRKDLSEIDFSKVPEWQSYDQILEAYKIIRRTRKFEDPEIPNFLRRITWLYYYDGCFTRAGLAAEDLDERGFPDVAQVFVFGSLYLQPQNVRWRYHVAPAARLADKVYILDVAINPERPLLWHEWVATFVHERSNPEASICHETTWSPGLNCENNAFSDESGGFDLDGWNREWWMPYERSFLKDRADQELGENPTWFTE